MLDKKCIMCMIITDVEMILLNHFMIIFIAIKTIDIKLCISIYNMNKYRYMILMIILTLYLLLQSESVIFSKIDNG